MSLIQNTNGFQTRFQTQMATPLAQEMTLAQGLRTLALVTSSLKTQMATPPVQANLAQEVTLAQDTTVCCNIGPKCPSMSLIQNTNGFQTRFQTQMATPPVQANLAQEMTLAQDTTVCCNIGPKCPSMSLIQNTNGFQTRFQTLMATPPAQEMILAQ